jgi:ABC-type phosphonate transport system, ATPase component
VNLQLHAGEFLGIVGESGSGKSTLLQMIYLALRPDSGHIWYRESDGQPRDLTTLNRYEARLFQNTHLGIVYQRPELGLNMRFSVGGNVAEKLLLAEWRHFGRIRVRTSELMNKTELLPERIDDEPTTFSGGMLQRVQIARALGQPSNHPVGAARSPAASMFQFRPEYSICSVVSNGRIGSQCCWFHTI